MNMAHEYEALLGKSAGGLEVVNKLIGAQLSEQFIHTSTSTSV